MFAVTVILCLALACAEPAVPQVREAAPRVDKQKTMICAVCESLIQHVENLLLQNSTQSDIVSALDKGCTLLPEEERGPCIKLLPFLTSYVIDLIERKLSPERACILVRICEDDGILVDHQVKSGPLCPICEYIMQELDSILAENATQEQIEKALSKVCSLLPVSVRSDCETFIDEYTPVLIQVLVQFPPDKVCGYLKFCSSKIKEVNQDHSGDSLGNSSSCALCELILEALDRYLSENATEAEIERTLDIVCLVLPDTLKTDCKNFVAQYTPVIIKLLLQETRPRQVCIAAGICPNNGTKVTYTEPAQSSVKTTVKPTVAKDSPGCAVCELVITELVNLLAENASVAQIEAELDKVCDSLPGDIKDLCEAFVQKYTPEIVQLLIQKVQPSQICRALKLCASYDSILGALIELQTPKANNAECFLCKFIVGKLKTMVAEHATEEEIKTALEKVCHLLPSRSQEKCKEIVDQYGSLIIHLLFSAITPEQICKEIRLCTDTAQGMDFSVSVPLSKDSIEGCTLCEFIMEEAQGVLIQPFIETSAEEVFDKICDRVLTKWKTPCRNLVAMFMPNIMDLLSKGLDPKSFCQLINLCEKRKEATSQKSQSLTFVPENKAQLAALTPVKDFCAECKASLLKVQSTLTYPLWQKETRTILNGLCTQQINGQNECRQLVDASLNSVISEIKTFQLPTGFCQKTDFCKDSVSKAGEARCTACNVLNKVVGSIIQKMKTVTEVTTVLVQTCNLLVPGEMKSECESLVKDYTSALTPLVSHISDPGRLCEAVSFCARPSHGKLIRLLTPSN